MNQLYDNCKKAVKDLAEHPVQTVLSSLPALAIGLPIYEYGDPIMGAGVGAAYFATFYRLSTAESRERNVRRDIRKTIEEKNLETNLKE